MYSNDYDRYPRKRKMSEFEEVCALWGVSLDNMSEYSRRNMVDADLEELDSNPYDYQEDYL